MSNKCLVRIPLPAWAVKFYLHRQRHKLAEDGISIHQTAKDFLGKLVTGYMRKTFFDPWYVGIPQTSHLRIWLPGTYNRHGLTKQDYENLSDMLKDLAQQELCFQVALFTTLPCVNCAQAIRITWDLLGLTDEDYDQEHFRRYFDRYNKHAIGTDFPDFSEDVNRHLKAFYDVHYLEKV
ncbi:hypothetical protein V8V91_08615 [Algoriphagus halophilus]|uniref:hypothetical protein n=1 Tax=Algoriphagus halophilus TaxID=226505 RepID=UPI00358F46EF